MLATLVRELRLQLAYNAQRPRGGSVSDVALTTAVPVLVGPLRRRAVAP